MGLLVGHVRTGRLPVAPLLLSRNPPMHSSFFQVVEGADDALNAGYKKDASSLTGHP